MSTTWLDDTTLGASAKWEDTTADPITDIRAGLDALKRRALAPSPQFNDVKRAGVLLKYAEIAPFWFGEPERMAGKWTRVETPYGYVRVFADDGLRDLDAAEHDRLVADIARIVAGALP